MSKKPNASASLALTGNSSTGPIPAHVKIDTVTVPAGDPGSFLFTSTLPGVASFTLTDADTPKDVSVEPGTYTVTETLRAGWDLTGISCSDGSNGSGTTATVTVTSGQTVTCTFTNTKNT